MGNDHVTKTYGVHGNPSVWLLDPAGRVVAKDLSGEKIVQTLTTTLANAK